MAVKLKPPQPPAGLTAVPPGEWLKVWIRVRAHTSVKAVGFACAYFANYGDGAEIRPGTVMLAAVCGEMSDRTAKLALVQIRGWGLIWRYVEGSKHGRRGMADVYRLTIPEGVLGQVPMLTPGNQVPERVSSDHVISDHVISATGTGDLSDTEQVISQPPTYPVTYPLTQPSTGVAVVGGSVEGNGNGAAPVENPDISLSEDDGYSGKHRAIVAARQAARSRRDRAAAEGEAKP
jgi:hypothetical protein